MKSVKPRQMIKVLEGELRVTVPYHNKDIKPGTLRNILKQSGLAEEDL